MLWNKLLVDINDMIGNDDYFIVQYYVEAGHSLGDVAMEIAVGQSIGNPSIRNSNETDELIEKHACKIINTNNFLNNHGVIIIAFPWANFEFDYVNQVFTAIMGGQLEMRRLHKCQIVDINFTEGGKRKSRMAMNLGIKKLRDITGVYDKPLLGGIIKPKIGMDIKTLQGVVEDMLEGGVNIVKEDEILGAYDFEQRLSMVDKLIDKYDKFIYLYCHNSPSDWYLHAIQNHMGIHVNFWAGMGTYEHLAINLMDNPVMFQRSGIQILTNPKHAFHISWKAMAELVSLMHVDIIHAGMIGGYSSDNEHEVIDVYYRLVRHDILPSMSCGMHAGLVDYLKCRLGNDWLANVGGAIHGHPGGVKAGAKAMRQAIDGTGGKEFDEAIKKWGKI